MPYSFEQFVLDPDRRELTQSGEAVSVEPQVFDLLVFLIENRDRVVTRDEVLQSVWRGRIVSESTLASRINAVRRALSDNGKAQRLISTVIGRGIRFVGEVQSRPIQAEASLRQSVTFCKTSDGINIAVARIGEGRPLVKAANWLNHLEYDWRSPIWAPLYRRLAARSTFIRYDGRGNGLSDRHVPEISFATFERDLEAVVDEFCLDQFALFGMSQGAATAVAYAAKFPDRVSKLVLWGAYPLGRNRRGGEIDSAVAQAVLTMMRQGWGDEHSAFMKAFSSVYLPEATAEQISIFADMQRNSAPADNAVRIRMACDDIDVLALLPQIKAPTLVLHGRHDSVAPFDQGRLVAAAIPRAQLVTLESHNHIPLPDEPQWERMVATIEDFLE